MEKLPGKSFVKLTHMLRAFIDSVTFFFAIYVLQEEMVSRSFTNSYVKTLMFSVSTSELIFIHGIYFSNNTILYARLFHHSQE